MRIGRCFLVSLRGLLALAGLAIGFALFAALPFSGCANGGFTSNSGQQQKTPVNTHARDQGGVPSSWVDWTKPAKDQTGDTYPRGHKGLGTP
jgi:hypothetical protein